MMQWVYKASRDGTYDRLYAVEDFKAPERSRLLVEGFTVERCCMHVVFVVTDDTEEPRIHAIHGTYRAAQEACRKSEWYTIEVWEVA